MLQIDTDDIPAVYLIYPGFDAFIAEGLVHTIVKRFATDGWDSKQWRPALAGHARASLSGFVQLDFQEPIHVDGPEAARAAMDELMQD